MLFLCFCIFRKMFTCTEYGLWRLVRDRMLISHERFRLYVHTWHITAIILYVVYTPTFRVTTIVNDPSESRFVTTFMLICICNLFLSLYVIRSYDNLRVSKLITLKLLRYIIAVRRLTHDVQGLIGIIPHAVCH